jgi:hypothetical protein
MGGAVAATVAVAILPEPSRAIPSHPEHPEPSRASRAIPSHPEPSRAASRAIPSHLEPSQPLSGLLVGRGYHPKALKTHHRHLQPARKCHEMTKLQYMLRFDVRAGVHIEYPLVPPACPRPGCLSGCLVCCATVESRRACASGVVGRTDRCTPGCACVHSFQILPCTGVQCTMYDLVHEL